MNKFKLVPVEPTPEMLQAGRETPCTASREDCAEDYRAVYKAMLAAAPQPAQQAETDAAYNEAKSLAESLFRKHYAHEEHYASGRVVWRLCDSTAGIISQINNMVSILVRPEVRAALEQPGVEPVADGWQLRCVYFKDGEPTMHKEAPQAQQPEAAYQRGYMDGLSKPCPNCDDYKRMYLKVRDELAELQQPAQQAEADALLNENRVLRESMTRCKDAGAAMAACWNEDKKEADALLDKALYVIEAWERDCDHEDYWRDRDDVIEAIKKYLGKDFT